MKIIKNSRWNSNVDGEYIIINRDGTLHMDGFETREDAESHLANCVAYNLSASGFRGLECKS